MIKVKATQEMEIIKLILVSLTLVWCLGVVVHGFTYDDKEVTTEDGKSAMFERWRSHHKLEKISEKDKKLQYNNFKANLEHVHNTNKANKGYKLELNRFSGMSVDELRSKYTGMKAGCPKHRDAQPFMYRNVTDIPCKMDWRTKQAVGPVKNQEQCGSCYAFAAVEAVEGLHAIKNKELIELSPKEIVDCGNVGGCNGGYFTACFEYIAKNGGLTTMKNYPYKPKVEPCNVQKEHDVAVIVHGYENVPSPGVEEDLYKAIANQPISCCMEVNENIVGYKEGVYDGPCGTRIDHAVSIVGWDTTPEGQKYWVIKNSWGEGWGEKGYMRIARDTGGMGKCGIAHWCAYPTLEDTGTQHRDDDPKVAESKDL